MYNITKGNCNLHIHEDDKPYSYKYTNKMNQVYDFLINNMNNIVQSTLVTLIDLITLAIADYYCIHKYINKHIKCDKPYYHHNIDNILEYKSMKPNILRNIIKSDNPISNEIIVGHIIPNIKEACEHYDSVASLLSNAISISPQYEIVGNMVQTSNTLFYIETVSHILPKIKIMATLYSNILQIIDIINIVNNIDINNKDATIIKVNKYFVANLVYYLVKYYGFKNGILTNVVPKSIPISEIDNTIMTKPYAVYIYNLV